MGDRRLRHRALAALALALAVVAALAGEADARAGRIGALELARWLRDGTPPVLVFDVRSRDAFDEYRLPGARHLPSAGLDSMRWRRGEGIVLYGGDEARTARALRRIVSLGAERAFVLDGGVSAWIDRIESPRLAPLAPGASSADSAARREHLALSRYFGGLPFVDPSLPPESGIAEERRGRARASTGAAAADSSIRAVRRRGC